MVTTMDFPNRHVWIWELDHKESWALKNWYFWTVVLEKTLQSPLDSKEIQPVYPKGHQSWIFIRRTDAEAETPIFWPSDAKNWLIGKDPDAGQDCKQEEKGTTEDEIVDSINGHEFEQALGDGEGQVSLLCCSPWGHKESDMTEQLNKNKNNTLCSLLLPLALSFPLTFLHRAYYPDILYIYLFMAISSRENACSHERSIPASGRSPGEGNGNLLQYSCLEILMDGGAWWATVHGVAKSQTQMSNFTLCLLFEKWVVHSLHSLNFCWINIWLGKNKKNCWSAFLMTATKFPVTKIFNGHL